MSKGFFFKHISRESHLHESKAQKISQLKIIRLYEFKIATHRKLENHLTSCAVLFLLNLMSGKYILRTAEDGYLTQKNISFAFLRCIGVSVDDCTAVKEIVIMPVYKRKYVWYGRFPAIMRKRETKKKREGERKRIAAKGERVDLLLGCLNISNIIVFPFVSNSD